MKAILVIDVDEKTIGREVNYIRVQGNGYSYIVKAVGENVRLRPLPHKKMPKQGEAFPQDMRLIDRWRGWDACIDEITGETE